MTPPCPQRPINARSTKPAALLGECVLFRGLSPKERSDLAARARMRNFPAGETIFLMGSSGDSMMAVLDGNVRISVPSPEGKEIVLAIIQPGDVFGEIALLDGKERTADAPAMTECTLAVLERRDVMAFLESNPSGWPRLVDLLCARLRHSDRQIAEMAFLQLPVRLAKALLRMADMAAGLSGARSGARIRLTQRELGNIVGMTRESVNKCLREWQRKGIIRIEDSAIVIAKRPALQKVAQNSLTPRSRNHSKFDGRPSRATTVPGRDSSAAAPMASMKASSWSGSWWNRQSLPTPASFAKRTTCCQLEWPQPRCSGNSLSV